MRNRETELMEVVDVVDGVLCVMQALVGVLSRMASCEGVWGDIHNPYISMYEPCVYMLCIVCCLVCAT